MWYYIFGGYYSKRGWFICFPFTILINEDSIEIMRQLIGWDVMRIIPQCRPNEVIPDEDVI
jgi:hypothetical protein